MPEGDGGAREVGRANRGRREVSRDEDRRDDEDCLPARHVRADSSRRELPGDTRFLSTRSRNGIETEDMALPISLPFFLSLAVLRGKADGRISWQILPRNPPSCYPSRYSLQNVGVDISGVQAPILEQQCDRFFAVRLRKPGIGFGAKQQAQRQIDRQSIRDTAAALDSCKSAVSSLGRGKRVLRSPRFIGNRRSARRMIEGRRRKERSADETC